MYVGSRTVALAWSLAPPPWVMMKSAWSSPCAATMLVLAGARVGYDSTTALLYLLAAVVVVVVVMLLLLHPRPHVCAVAVVLVMLSAVVLALMTGQALR